MGLFKRGRVWWMNITHRGRRIRRSCETADRRLAEAIVGKVRAKLVEGRFFDKLEETERTFAEMMERYLKDHSVTKSAQSLRRDQQMLQHMLPVLGRRTLAEVSPKLVAGYKAKRRGEGAKPATINKELGFMRHAFNLARREWEWCQDNPARKVALETVRTRIDRWLTAEEEKRLLATCAQWLREIIVFALNTGMRKGEIIALRWQDVDLTRGVLFVHKSKNNEPRCIPLNAEVFSVLVGKEARRSSEADLVFTTSVGTKLNPRGLSRAFERAVSRAGLQHCRVHDMRHSFATRLVQRGVDLYKVQRLLGHKSHGMTQRYAHHSTESLRDGVRALEVGTQNLSQSCHTGVSERRLTSLTDWISSR